MVAISLYRGNLHRVPTDTPRRWVMPSPRISLKNFRRLLDRRSKALSLLPSTSSAAAVNSKPVMITLPAPEKLPALTVDVPNPSSAEEKSNVEAKVEDAGDCRPLDPVVTPTDCVKDEAKEKEKEKQIPALQEDVKLDPEKEKRKREIEEKLQVLNEKKHSLVQALKLILNAEEELKRRSSVQANRPPLPHQVDASNDSGSMTRHATPRAGSDGNVAVDMEVGEGDDTLNLNPQSRPLVRMSSTSPSAESALRRTPYFQHQVASHPSRAAMVAAGSPSRFAPLGNQANPSNLPTVSVSGTNYIASSPSPAASGGTSGFRDARQPSPWN